MSRSRRSAPGQLPLDQQGLRVVVPNKQAAPRRRRRKPRSYPTWGAVRISDRVWVTGESIPEPRPGTVTSKGWHPVQGSYAVVRMDDGGPPCTCDWLSQLRPMSPEELQQLQEKTREE